MPRIRAKVPNQSVYEAWQHASMPACHMSSEVYFPANDATVARSQHEATVRDWLPLTNGLMVFGPSVGFPFTLMQIQWRTLCDDVDKQYTDVSNCSAPAGHRGKKIGESGPPLETWKYETDDEQMMIYICHWVGEDPGAHLLGSHHVNSSLSLRNTT